MVLPLKEEKVQTMLRVNEVDNPRVYSPHIVDNKSPSWPRSNNVKQRTPLQLIPGANNGERNEEAAEDVVDADDMRYYPDIDEEAGLEFMR